MRRITIVGAVATMVAVLLVGTAGGAAALPSSLDGDGDGWMNTVETLLGSDAGDPFKTPESFAIPASCLDGADNDGDGATDDADPGCHPIPVIDGTFPPAGFDVFESDLTLNGLVLETPDGGCGVNFEGVGPTVVRRGNPTGSGGDREIDVEIVAMQLTGTAQLLSGTPCNQGQRALVLPMTLMEDPAKASAGKVTAQQSSADFPASSFFDVNFQVDSPLGLIPGSLRVTNDTINTLPPFHTPNDPAKNPNCYDFGGAHEHCPKPPLDHFQCYAGDFPDFAPQRVRLLLDQFGGSPVEVFEPNLFCNPVAKNRLPIFDRDAHLKFYRVRSAVETPAKGAPVVVRNQFGTQTFEVGDRVAIAVPTRKNQQGPPLALDHYACYEITGNQLNRPVALQDQFGNSNTVVSRPVVLCNPAVKVHNRTLTEVQDERWHLVCYAIQPTPLNPTTLTARNQFGAETIVARQPVSLCVPSQKFFERFRPRIPHGFGFQDPATGRWHLRGLGGQEVSFFFGNPGDIPFMGDWDCDGIDTPGLYRSSDGFVYLRNSNDAGFADVEFFFGNPGDVPLPGDFNDDGCDTVSLFRPAIQRMFVINKLGSRSTGLGAADFDFLFGNPGDKPVIGDWDGDGIDELGLHRESTGFFYYRNSLDTGIASDEIFFGDPGDRFVAGDWGVVDGKDTPAVFRPGDRTFYLRDTLTQGVADEQIPFGAERQGFLPVAGVFTDGFESGDVTR